MNITSIIEKQRKNYRSGQTKSYSFRIESLRKLKSGIIKYQKSLETALHTDLGKSPIESYFAEIGITLKEISHMEKHLKKYMRNKIVKTSITDFPARSFISPHPYGVTLIMSPWNYPVMLTLCPLVGALAAGNTAILKPSDYSPNTSKILKELINDSFDEALVAVITGGREENQTLLDQKFDYIFFTGGKTVGRIVMEKAAKNLTPVSLELGGKSPCIVDKTANLKYAARRIAFGKYLNAGQTCVAPDYLFIHETVKDEFFKHFQKALTDTFGSTPLQSPHLGKIINDRHYQRLKNLITEQTILVGGEFDDQNRKIEPTVLDNIDFTNKIMEDEIFGPILPVLGYKDITEAYDYINRNPAPLAFYLFTNNLGTEKQALATCNFGGGCINDAVVHVASDSLPFGGVGESGMGSYHGKASFDTFTHYRSVLRKSNWFDPTFRYAPYTSLKEKIIRMFLR